MADYNAILDTQIDPDAPLTANLASQFRDNPIAIAEGAVGSPSVLPNIAANADADGLGTYVFASRLTNAATAYGATVAGSNLVPTSAARSVRVDSDGLAMDETSTLGAGTALTGTWRCMGQYAIETQGGSSSQRVVLTAATLWVKIAA